jgi:hypothetical protein
MHTHSDGWHIEQAVTGEADDLYWRKVEQLSNLRSERRKYASGVYRIQPDRLAGILAHLDSDIGAVLAEIETIKAGGAK